MARTKIIYNLNSHSVNIHLIGHAKTHQLNMKKKFIITQVPLKKNLFIFKIKNFNIKNKNMWLYEKKG